MRISPGRAPRRNGAVGRSCRRNRAAPSSLCARKTVDCGMIMGPILENSSNNRVGAYTVFQGAFAPGGFKYADMIESKSIGISCFVYTLSRQNLTRPWRA
jgi:hypothetical protein